MKRTILRIAFLLAVSFFAFTQTPGQEQKNTASQQTLDSPRLAALKKELEQGNRSALERFWQEIKKSGAPLIEAIKGDKANMLLTFLWRAREDTKNVLVISPLVPPANLSEQEMARLPETDLWYKTYRVRKDVRLNYSLSPNDPVPLLGETKDPAVLARRTENFQLDPFNPKRFKSFPKDVSIVELPGAPPQPWVTKRPGVPTGKVEEHKIKSASLDSERTVWIYTPPGYTPTAKPYRLLVLFDGEVYTDTVPTPIILDNLLAKKMLPPTVAVFVGVMSFELRRRDLPCYPPFFEFLVKELIPWVRENYHVTTDPSETIVGGSSYGGLASAYAAFRYPEIFGNILSQSGSYWWKPNDDPAFGWLIRQYEASPKLPLRFYLDVGLMEIGANGTSPMIDVNRRMRDILQAKGYDVTYQEFNGGHQYINWQGTLVDGLLALTGKESSEKRRKERRDGKYKE